ncbi:hypothetical protein HQ865_04275 [Mucilaginibacter mali]|uniref:Uncharacterized protein n=1 Tax=Mucilaginibacter mali TaxID=2740462 RepID=A0A7D4UJE5_9SPHI|nr:hypothetical protein [Mucilaginibacter mali]QKJ29002.1 hypothetical protein HQ865_04275 [Mucilaginibacter mali]
MLFKPVPGKVTGFFARLSFPQAASAESWTVYQYAYNNPGMLNDLTGASMQRWAEMGVLVS